MADLLEHEPVRPPPATTWLALGCALTLGAGVVAVARHQPPPSPAVAAADGTGGAAAEPWNGPRRVPAALLPPGRPRRNSPTQIGQQRPEVPSLGTVAAGPAPAASAAHRAAYSMVARLCRDPSLVRLRALQRSDDWSAVTYYARVYEDPPSYGGFAIALRWTGSEYAYTVTGKAGDCRDRGTG